MLFLWRMSERTSMKKLFVVALLLLEPLMSEGQTIRVLRSDLGLEQRKLAISGAKLIDNRRVDMSDFSICMRFNYQVLHRSGQGVETLARVIGIESWRDSPDMTKELEFLWFAANHPNSFLGFGHPNAGGSYRTWLIRDPANGDTEVWSTNRWNHWCFSFAKKSAFVKFAKDGRIMNINHTDPNVENATIPSNILQNVYLARCALDYHQRCSAVGGKVADLNIWDRPLTDREMADFTSCRDMSFKGNVVDWNLAKFDLYNMSEIYEAIESVCVPPRPGDVLFPEPRNFTAHLALCNKMRGGTALIDSKQKEENFLREADLKSFSACNNDLWTGYWDEPLEGTFTNGNNDSQEMGDFLPWAPGEPNGGTLENCVVLSRSSIHFNDIGCENEICGFCHLDYEPVLKIRGLCSGSLFDQKYSWTQATLNERFAFFGIKDTLLFYNPESKEWKLELHSKNDTFAVTRGEDYPFGSHRWTIYNDPCYKDIEGNLIPQVTVFLNLNNCDEDAFNCNDGACVPMAERCDGRVHCPDRSDEIGCQIFFTDPSYLKFMPPAGASNALFPVEMSVDVVNVLGISEVENYINLQLRIHLKWKDSRLRMSNLKLDSDLNSLTREMREQLWIPEIVFYNTDELYESVNDEKASAIIHRNGSFKREPTSSVQNGYIFQGKENPITLSRVYSFKYLCKFDMNNYPFDTQRCSADFTMKGNMRKFVKLIPKELDYIGPVDLTQYFVQEYDILESEILSGVMGVKVQLVFGRRLLSTILTTYLPTVLICLVSFTTNFYKGFFFEAIVTVNLTSLLLLVTLFISVSESLPKTAYIKTIDIWLIFILFVPFTEVFVHTIIDNLRTEEERNINHHGTKRNVSDTDPDVFGQSGFERIQNGNNKIHVKEAPNPHVDPEGDDVINNTSDNSASLSKEEKKRILQLRIALLIARFVMPAIFVAFCIGYSLYGLLIYGTPA